MLPKLGDFRTSKLLQASLRTSTAVGSVNYMAPEIIGGLDGNPSSSDVYRYVIIILDFCVFCSLLLIIHSFGCLMHELATSTVSL